VWADGGLIINFMLKVCVNGDVAHEVNSGVPYEQEFVYCVVCMRSEFSARVLCHTGTARDEIPYVSTVVMKKKQILLEAFN
jgi:hypothetical protein